jgi:hypothetical protein
MENLLEILFPLIFAAVYFFGNLLSKKNEESGEPRPERRDAEAYEETSAEQQIKEQIRRKIEARRAAAEGRALPPEAAEPAPAAPQRTTRERLKEGREQYKQTQEAPHEVPAQTSNADDGAPGGFSWEASDHAYAQVIEAQQRKIEATQRQAAALRSKAHAARAKMPARRGSAESKGGVLAGPVRSSLSNPAAARAAFIYSEVLGAPAGLQQQSPLPGLRA